MDVGQYRCVECRNSLAQKGDQLVCMGCGNDYPVREASVPIFVTAKQPDRKFSIGVASQLFEAPLLYESLVRFKSFVAPDSPLGIRDVTDGCSLLNIGCGTDVEARHLEYDIHAVTRFSAMDLSESFVLAAKRKCSRKDANFCVASITSLPYADSSVDVVIIPFVLHHLPFPLSLGLKEALRVAAKYVVVFDHISSDESPVMKAIQELYWRLFDGGHQYLGGAEWKVILDGLSVVRNLRTGAIGGHVCKFIIEKQVSK